MKALCLIGAVALGALLPAAAEARRGPVPPVHAFQGDRYMMPAVAPQRVHKRRWHGRKHVRRHSPKDEAQARWESRLVVAPLPKRRPPEADAIPPVAIEPADLPDVQTDPEEGEKLRRMADAASTLISPQEKIQNIFDGFRTFLIRTAIAGGTMTRQGKTIALGRLHPEFARRLSRAIAQARKQGLPKAGIYSAYRPPAFNVGGFRDKMNSLHAYGLAVDMAGIGRPGSRQALLWHKIAAQNGIHCPYGYRHRAEWNHCQLVAIRIVLPRSPLRRTITRKGPISNERMWKAADILIDRTKPVVVTISARRRHIRGHTRRHRA